MKIPGPIQIKRGLKSALPSTGYEGQLFFCTDTKELFIVDGGVLVPVSSSGESVVVTLPVSTSATTIAANDLVSWIQGDDGVLPADGYGAIIGVATEAGVAGSTVKVQLSGPAIVNTATGLSSFCIGLPVACFPDQPGKANQNPNLQMTPNTAHALGDLPAQFCGGVFISSSVDGVATISLTSFASTLTPSNNFTVTWGAAAPISAGQVVALLPNSSNRVIPCTSTLIPVGVAQNDAALDDSVNVVVGGFSEVNTILGSGSVSAGDLLAVDDASKVIKAAPAAGQTLRIIGFCPDATVSPGDQVITYVLPLSVTGDSVAAIAGAVTASELYTDGAIASEVTRANGAYDAAGLAAAALSTAEAYADSQDAAKLSQVADGVPLVDGTADRGTSAHAARTDHVHPTDASRQAALGFTPENVANKDAANGYAGLDASVLLKTTEMPALTGDVTSTAGSVATTVAKLQGKPLVYAPAPSAGQVLEFDGVNWTPTTINSSPVTLFCNNATKSGKAYVLTQVATGGGNATYTGTISDGASNALAGKSFVVTGFANSGNNATITITASTATTLVCALTTQTNETHAGTATLQAKTWSATPDVTSEHTTALSITNAMGDTFLEEFYTAAGYPGVTVLPQGAWQFDLYLQLSSAAGTTTMYVRVYKRAAATGVETELFNTASSPVTISGQGTGINLFTLETQQPPITLLADDTLVFKIVINVSATRVVTLHYDGANNYSHVHTPIGIVGPLVTSVAGRTGDVVLAETDVTNLVTDLAAKEAIANKGAASGYCDLDSSSLVPASRLRTPTASVLGAVKALAAVAKKYITSIGTDGVPVAAQPDFGDLVSAPWVAGYGDTFPISQCYTNAVNVPITTLAANAGYSLKVRVKDYITFTKATTVQPSGTVAGVNVYLGLYNIAGQLVFQLKFTTVNPGGVSVTLAATVTGTTTIVPGTYYWIISIDQQNASAGTILGGPSVTDRIMYMMNANGYGYSYKLNVLSGGALPSTITITDWTKNQAPTVPLVYLEP